MHKPNSIFEAAHEILAEAKLPKNPPSLEDPVWDAAFPDGKGWQGVDTNLTWSEIYNVVKSRYPGAKVVTDTFTVMDLKTGVHKSIIFNRGAKGSVRVRVQLHPMDKAKLKKDPDSFGTVK